MAPDDDVVVIKSNADRLDGGRQQHELEINRLLIQEIKNSNLVAAFFQSKNNGKINKYVHNIVAAGWLLMWVSRRHLRQDGKSESLFSFGFT